MDKNQILRLNLYLFTKLTKSKLKEQPEVTKLDGLDFFSDVDITNGSFTSFIKSKLTTNMVKLKLDCDQNLNLSLNLSDIKDAEYFTECLDTLIVTFKILETLIKVCVEDYNELNKTNFELKTFDNMKLIAKHQYLRNVEKESENLKYSINKKEVERKYFEWWISNSSINEIRNNFEYPESGCEVIGIFEAINLNENGENKSFKVR